MVYAHPANRDGCRAKQSPSEIIQGITMKKFLAVYLGSPSGFDEWKMMDEATRKQKEGAGMQAWKDWMTTNAQAVVDHGSPLGKTKRISKTGIADTRNNMGGYTIVQAESHEAAAKLFMDHPHYAHFPGDAVELMECLPIPGM